MRLVMAMPELACLNFPRVGIIRYAYAHTHTHTHTHTHIIYQSCMVENEKAFRYISRACLTVFRCYCLRREGDGGMPLKSEQRANLAT